MYKRYVHDCFLFFKEKSDVQLFHDYDNDYNLDIVYKNNYYNHRYSIVYSGTSSLSMSKFEIML